MSFGKRQIPLREIIAADKKDFDREFLHFGKRGADSAPNFERDFMAFGKKR